MADYRNERLREIASSLEGFDQSLQGADDHPRAYSFSADQYHDHHQYYGARDVPRVSYAHSDASTVNSGSTACSQAPTVFSSAHSTRSGAGAGARARAGPSNGGFYTLSQGSHRMPTAYTHSEAPSTHTALHDFDRYLIRSAHPTDPNYATEGQNGVPVLTCEFFRLSGCTSKFQADEIGVKEYMAHVYTQHLRNKYPSACSCWWCDDFVFRFTDDRSGHDRATNFAQRMAHIQAHLWDAALGGSHCPDFLYFSDPYQRRPDFHMLEYLQKHNLISEVAFEDEKARSEAPPTGDVYPAGWRPKRSERAAGVEVNLEAEERRRRRGRGGSGEARRADHHSNRRRALPERQR